MPELKTRTIIVAECGRYFGYLKDLVKELEERGISDGAWITDVNAEGNLITLSVKISDVPPQQPMGWRAS